MCLTCYVTQRFSKMANEPRGPVPSCTGANLSKPLWRDRRPGHSAILFQFPLSVTQGPLPLWKQMPSRCVKTATDANEIQAITADLLHMRLFKKEKRGPNKHTRVKACSSSLVDYVKLLNQEKGKHLQSCKWFIRLVQHTGKKLPSFKEARHSPQRGSINPRFSEKWELRRDH